MFKIIRQLFGVLTPAQRKNYYFLQVLVILMAIMEIIGVASIVPFMALVGDLDQLNQDSIFGRAYIASGINTEFKFILILGISVLVLLIISSAVSIFTIWRLTKFAHMTGAELADRLYSYYLNKDWLFHASGNSSDLTKKIATETLRTTQGIIVQLMQMNAKIVLAIFVTITVFFYDPKVAISGFLIFSMAYIFLFNIVKIRIQRNGNVISDVWQKRYGLMNEGFGGIKDILLLGRDLYFIDRFRETGRKLAYSLGNNAALAQAPRYFIEFVAFGSIILLVIYLFVSHNGDLGVIIPSLTVYAVASVKILPAFQQIYSSIADIRGNISAFESIQSDLADSLKTDKFVIKDNKKILSPQHKITIENVSFNYDKKEEFALNELNIEIPVKDVIGIVGTSGSGKSTVIDIFLGLIKPKKGHLKVDDITIDDHNVRSWQDNIGFVAQSIFISDSSIAENVAFGIPKDKINIERVIKSLELAHLLELVETFKDGIFTNVGERGVQISGGQRQRIGIARSLYHGAEVLVFDEATSSLDGITEKMIMQAIHEFSGEKTIILIAHRLKTVEKCDQIFFMDKGKIIDQGTYKELIKKNKLFKNMANNA